VDGLARAPQLMNALQQNFTTDLTFGDMSALYQTAGSLSDSSIEHLALTDADLLASYFQRQDSCGPYYVYVLCPDDPTYGTIHTYFQNDLGPKDGLAGHVPVQSANGRYHPPDLAD